MTKFLMLFVFSNLPRLIWNLENTDIADVVIGIDVQGYKSEFDPATKAFLDELVPKATVAEDKIRISVVEFARSANLLVSFNDGTDPDEIRGVELTTHQQPVLGKMSNEKIGRAVRDAAFRPNSGQRPHAPDVVIVLAQHQSVVWNHFQRSATTAAKEMAEVDVVILFNKFNGSAPFFLHVYNSGSSGNVQVTNGTIDDFFRSMASKAIEKLQDVLKRCPYERHVSETCYYGDQGQCTEEIEIRPDATVTPSREKYCIGNTTVPCSKGVKECEDQCHHVAVWSECVNGHRLRRPRDPKDDRTIRIYERCMRFENYGNVSERCPMTTTTEESWKTEKPEQTKTTEKSWKTEKSEQTDGVWQCDVGSGFVKVMRACLPLWLTLVIVTSVLIVAAVVSCCVTRRIYLKRLETEKKKHLESLRRRSSPESDVQSKHHKPTPTPGSFKKKESGGLDENKSDSAIKLSARLKSSVGQSKIQKSILSKSAIDQKSKLGGASQVPPKSIGGGKRPNELSALNAKSEGGGSAESGLSKPPSLTDRSPEQMLRDMAKIGPSKPNVAKSVRSTSKPSSKSVSQFGKRFDMTHSKGYRS